MPERPWKDEYTLLCEKCGYVLEGLDTSGNCPECGKPIAESLPERRVGTPWQQRPGVRSLLATWWMTLRHPLRTLDVMRIGSETHWWLLFINILIASVYFIASATSVVGQMGAGIDSTGWLLISTESALTATILVMPTLFILTIVEQFGLTIIARNKGVRIDIALARITCEHGSVGWIISALLGSTALFLVAWISSRTAINAMWWPIALLAFIPGFLFFETFAYLGLRRCKYANRLKPTGSNLAASVMSSPRSDQQSP